MPLGTFRSELLRTRVHRFTRVLDGVERGEMRSVHRARVASRRLRELMPVLQIDNDVSKKLARRLRRVTSRLGTVREFDVLLLLINELRKSRPNLAHALERLGLAAAKTRDEARQQLLDHLPVDQMRRVARKLDRVVDALRADEKDARPRQVTRSRAVRWAVDTRVVYRANRLQSAINAAGAVYLPDRLHAVRIALKKLRYAVELSADIAGHRKMAPILRALKQGQDVLGRMHDLQVLIDRAREMQASLAPPNVAIWRELDALVITLEQDCRRLHARYVRHRTPLISITTRLARVPASTLKRRAG